MKFESYHPTINLIYFVAAIAFTFWFSNPVYTAIAFVCAFIFSVKLNGKRAVVFNCCLFIFIIVFTFLYTYFVHFGITNIGETFIGNKITLESLMCGADWAFKIATAIIFLSCFFAVFSTDKVVYLFGKISPRLSLALSVIFRTVPRVKKEMSKINSARRGMGKNMFQGNFTQRMKNFGTFVSAIISFMVENYFESTMSMKNRGHSLKGRTSFSIYRFDKRDRTFVIVMFLLIFLTLMAWAFNQTTVHYDPQFVMVRTNFMTYVFYVVYAGLLLMPAVAQSVSEVSFRRAAGTIVR